METMQLVSGGVVTWTQAVRDQSLGYAAHQIPPGGLCGAFSAWCPAGLEPNQSAHG